MNNEKLVLLIAEMKKLNHRFELSQSIGEDYFEPGLMEFLDKSYGEFDEEKKTMILRFEVRGTRYEGRTARIEHVRLGDKIILRRDFDNIYNSNNYSVEDAKGHNLGNVPAELCNAIAPLHDANEIEILDGFVSFVEPISKRSRYAKQGILFVEVSIFIK